MRTLGLGLATAVLGLAGVADAAGQRIKTADYSFSYSYPDAANRYPGLRAYLAADQQKARASIVRDVSGARAEAGKSGYPFHPYEATVTWKLVTDTPRFVSLSADRYSYTGGAHGNPASGSIIWDKQAGRALPPTAVFVSAAMVEAAVRASYCRQLDAQRLKRRGEPTARSDMFGNCPQLKELTLLLGSSGGGRINRVGLIADAYVAGPYAEGAYEVTLPVTPALIRAVQPAYRAAFAAR